MELDASVLIVTYNSADVIDACLTALRGLRRPAGEVIVIDNASADRGADRVAKRHGWVRLIRQRRNLGFGGACNLGLGLARGRWPVLLNPDTRVDPDWLEALLAALQADPRIGIAGSKILEPGGAVIQHLGGVVHPNALTDHIGRGQPDDRSGGPPVDCDYVSGASLVLRRELLRGLGGFDPGFYPAYFEETDLCWRAHRRGWRVVVVPESRLEHLESASSGKLSGDFLERYHRNRIRFVLKNYTLAELRGRFRPAERAWIASGNATESRPALRLAWRRIWWSWPSILWWRWRGGPRLRV